MSLSTIQGMRKVTLFPSQLDLVQRVWFKYKSCCRVSRLHGSGTWGFLMGCAPCMWNSKCISGLGHADVLWPCPGKLLQFLVGQQGAVGTVQCGAGMGWPASAWTLIRGKSPPFPWLGSSSSFWAGEAMKFLLNPKYTPIKKLLSDPKWDIPLLMTKQLFPSSWLW